MFIDNVFSYLFFILVILEKHILLSELSRLRNLPISTVGWELTNSSAMARRTGQEKWNLIRVLRTPRLHLPLCLVIALQAGQQFSGISAVMSMYSDEILLLKYYGEGITW